MRCALLALALVGCHGESSEPLELSCELQTLVGQENQLPVDLLFVIDRSPAMADFQTALANNLGWFMETLRFVDGLDLRAGVVAADLADGADLLGEPRIPGCPRPDGSFLRYRARPDGTAATNFDGSLEEAAPCVGLLGASGGTARPLSAVRAALANPVNAGFLRDGASLAIVVLTAGDDPGDEDADALHDSLVALKRPIHFAAAGMAATRLLAFTRRFASDGVYTDIRNQDWSDLLRTIGAELQIYLAPCLHGPVDPARAGLDCTFSEVTGDWRTPLTETLLARCPGPRPCWSLRVNPGVCSAGLEVVVVRDEYLARGTSLVARCPALCARP
jgi:hypothetical protein